MRPPKHVHGRNRVECGTRALGVGCALAEQTAGKKLRQSTTLPIWGAAMPLLIIMNFGLLGDPTDIFRSTKLCL
jgi:hypothetical protein